MGTLSEKLLVIGIKKNKIKIRTCFIGKLEARYHLPGLYRQWTKLIMIIVQQMSSLGRICFKSAGRIFTRKLKKNPMKINVGSCFCLVPSFLWNWWAEKIVYLPCFHFLCYLITNKIQTQFPNHFDKSILFHNLRSYDQWLFNVEIRDFFLVFITLFYNFQVCSLFSSI